MARIAQIVSTARYLPEHVVTNAELTARFAALGRPDVINKLAARTGINQRFYAPKDWVTSDLALAAAKEALKRAGRKPEDVDLVILGTTSPDYIAPNTAVTISKRPSGSSSCSMRSRAPTREWWLHFGQTKRFFSRSVR